MSIRSTGITRRTALTGLTAGSLAALSACGTSTESSGSEITWWGWNPDDSQYQDILDLFHEDHPEVTVTYRFIQNSDYLNTLRLALTSGEGPDVFGLQTGAMTDQFAPLAADLAPHLEESLGGEWESQLISAEQLRVDGAQVGVPWMVTGGGTIEVNVTLLESLGLEVPQNIDDWEEVSKALAAKGLDCLEQGAKDAWQNIDVFQTLANQVEKGYFYNGISGAAPFASAQMEQAFSAWKSLFDRSIIQEGAFGTTAYPDAADAFRSGEAGMIAFGSWQNPDMTTTRLESYAETYGDDALLETEFLIVPFPSIVDPAADPELTMFGGPDVAWAMNSSSAAPDAAWTFIQWLATSEASTARTAAQLLQPALAGSELDMNDVVTDRQREALEAQGPALADLVGPREIADADVNAALGDALAGVAQGSSTPADAAASVQSAIDAASS